MKICQNCGHQCHCGTTCTQQHTDGDGKIVEIECCKACRHETKIENPENWKTYDDTNIRVDFLIQNRGGFSGELCSWKGCFTRLG